LQVVVIRFADQASAKAGIKVFKQYGEAVPTGEPGTFFVSMRLINMLKAKHIPFRKVKGKRAPSATMFAELAQSLAQARAGKVIYVKDPQSLDDVINARE
jgi:hypothetical protein